MSARARRWMPVLLAAGIVLTALLVAWLLVPTLAEARPGGGQSFSGGGGGGGGGGGSSGDGGCIIEILFYLILLCIEHPTIGIPLTLLFLGFLLVRAIFMARRSKLKNWSTSLPQSGPNRAWAQPQTGYRPPAPRAPVRDVIRGLFQRDADFSLIVFEDFLYALYATAHAARGKGQIETLSAYLQPAARSMMATAPGLVEVRTPVVGAMTFADAQPSSGLVVVRVKFEANYSEGWKTAHGQIAERTFYTSETWTLARDLLARSRAPQDARIFKCPSCGAPLESVRGSVCSYCQATVDTGKHDWVVTAIQVHQKSERSPQITGDVQEQGTHLPTVVSPGAQPRLAQLQQKDPSFDVAAFRARVETIFAELQIAWSTLDWPRARPFVSDSWFQMQWYWVTAYQQAGLRNITERARITGFDLANVVSDRWFDAITVRVHATGLDYTVDSSGTVKSGSKSRERAYTEYWTLIRGSSVRGAARADKSCPSCGAPLKINMTGACEFCSARVTTGEFDWVLSRIEQDETYVG